MESGHEFEAPFGRSTPLLKSTPQRRILAGMSARSYLDIKNFLRQLYVEDERLWDGDSFCGET